MRKFILLLVGLVACCGFAAEDSAVVTQQILEETMDRGVEILKDESLGFDHKMDAFEVLLKGRCHTDLMAYFVLGRSGWSQLSAEQRPEFIDSFIQMVTRSYYTKMDMADVLTVKIVYGSNDEISETKRALNAVIKDDVTEYHVKYKMALRSGRWGIYDLEIEGISLLLSYRSEYADYLKTHSGAELIEMLQQKTVAAVAEPQ